MDGTSTLSEPLHVDTVRDSTPLVSQKSKYFYFFSDYKYICHPTENFNNISGQLKILLYIKMI